MQQTNGYSHKCANVNRINYKICLANVLLLYNTTHRLKCMNSLERKQNKIYFTIIWALPHIPFYIQAFMYTMHFNCAQIIIQFYRRIMWTPQAHNKSNIIYIYSHTKSWVCYGFVKQLLRHSMVPPVQRTWQHHHKSFPWWHAWPARCLHACHSIVNLTRHLAIDVDRCLPKESFCFFFFCLNEEIVHN